MFGKAEELIILLIIILVLFGAKKLPELSRAVGESVREVRKGFREEPEVKPAETKVAAKPAKTQNKG